MKIFWATLGAAALKLLFAIITVMVVALLLWVLVPLAFPVTFSFGNGVGVAGLLFLVKGIFK